MFTKQNTSGYSEQQIAKLNTELAERTQGIDPESYEFKEAEKAFCDEVAQRRISAKTIATVRTYDPSDCTSTGYCVSVRSDGTLRIERHSRWQGSTAGTVWRVRAPDEIMAAARAEEEGDEIDDDEADLESLVYDFLAGDWQSSARLIRKGYRVQ